MIKRIAALILAAVMTLSMSGYVLEEVYAETESTGTEQQEQVVYDVDEDDPEPVAVPENKDEPATETPETTKEEPAKETVVKKQEPAKSGESESSDPEKKLEIELTALEKSGSTFTATVSWNAYENAEGYRVTVGSGDDAEEESVSGTSYTLSGLEAGKDYELTIKAVKTEDSEDGSEEAILAESKFTVRTYINPEVAENNEESSYENGQRVWKNSMKISWDAVPAEGITYDIRMEGRSLNDKSKVLEEKEFKDLDDTSAVFEGLFPSRTYSFTVTAKTSNGEYLTVKEALEAQPKLEKLQYRDLNSGSISPGALTFGNGSTDLRGYAGQSAGGYAVAQGGATDGQYAYILLVSSGNQYGRLAKVSVSNPSGLAAVSDTLPTTHGNGITYDSRRNRIVVIGRDDAGTGRYKRQEITVIDAANFSTLIQRNLDYSNYSGDTSYFTPKQQDKGLGAIAYSPKYDVYIAKQRDHNNLIVIDPDTLKAIGLIMTRVNQHGGSGQAMDGDDQFVYMLKSSYGSSNTNVLFALDWNGNEMLNDEGYRKAFVPGLWACIHGKETAQGSLTPRTPVAMYYINTPYEAENTFHIFDSNGGMHFYMTEYNPNQQYTSAQQAYQAKWKKVKKKVRVRVKKKKKVKKKVNGKWKKVKVTYYKYKWKKKKVWLYKTKYRTVQVPTYKERLDYIYDLGVF